MESLSERMAHMARHLQETHGNVQDTFDSAVEAIHASIEGCDAAGLSFVKRGGVVETVAATGVLAEAADRLQYEVGEGPCIDAVWDRHVVRSQSLAYDARWPTWGPRVVSETGAQSVLSFQLFTHAEHLGAMNLYSKAKDAFDEHAVEEGFAIAAHISIAVAAATEADALANGLASRAVIGQATGILMERYDLTPEAAFAVLTRMSSQGNIKIRHLAVEIVKHRHESSQ